MWAVRRSLDGFTLLEQIANLPIAQSVASFDRGLAGHHVDDITQGSLIIGSLHRGRSINEILHEGGDVYPSFHQQHGRRVHCQQSHGCATLRDAFGCAKHAFRSIARSE